MAGPGHCGDDRSEIKSFRRQSGASGPFGNHMSQRRSTVPPTASLEAKRQSLDQWKQLMTRYPLTSRWALGFQILTALSANALIAWLVMTRRMTPFELVVLVALEAALLISVAWLQGKTVPPEAIEKHPMSMRERLGTLAFGLFWLGGVYSFVFFGFVPSSDEFLRAARDPLTFLASSNLKWPLAITAAGALVDALQDAAHFRRHGGTFLSTPGFHGAARWLTLFLGGIPFFVPLVGFVVVIKLVGERVAAKVQKHFGNRNGRALPILILMIPFAAWGVLSGVGWIGEWLEPMIEGVGWWALCYATAKFVADLFVVSLPLIASKAHAEETEALAKPATAQGKRKSKLPG